MSGSSWGQLLMVGRAIYAIAENVSMATLPKVCSGGLPASSRVFTAKGIGVSDASDRSDHRAFLTRNQPGGVSSELLRLVAEGMSNSACLRISSPRLWQHLCAIGELKPTTATRR